MRTSDKQPTFLVHDYETFGKHPALDKPAQFAGIRANAEFEPISEPDVFFCRPPDDYLPDPEAVLITGITPQQCLRDGVTEDEFAAKIHQLFTAPDTCILGYNNVRFDDEVTRNIFYRNFYDPYAWSWQQGNSRWDLLDVMRACYALRPDGINWPTNDSGLPSFRLEHLTQANGIEHANAHDAMADVYATLAMARLVRQAQPKLFDYLYQHRGKNKLKTLIDIAAMKPLVHVSGMFGAERGNTAWIVPLAWHPTNSNALIVCDLAGDMQLLADLSSDQLRQRLYTPRSQLGSLPPVPIKLVHINKCPVLAPASTLRPEDAARLGIDRQQCLQNLKHLRHLADLRDKVVALFADAEPFAPTDNVDAQLYDGFFGDADRAAMDIIRKTPPVNLPALDITFVDRRLEPLLFRYRARNFSHTLTDQEQQRWHNHRQDVLAPEKLHAYVQTLEGLYEQHQADKSKARLLKALFDYLQQL
ncbi:exodeoxyribonuclease I [Biostraticola tofi]|uniref:Exodeoxyribonuclease I n=1 Tax=Biostraticola tofi TaxID=466109 RepID=A0A4R3Z4S2_9GAMM|nr:exodeoxyribonuclease I [Biostraticola tofi]TCW00183.1 exodeoxyribonuclease I subunit C [Biostraticola tofi]